jgi:hypothetical protein
MSIVKTLCSIMTSRRTVVLRDGRTGFITRVCTSYPEAETTVHVWTHAGPGLSKVRAQDVSEAPQKKSG